MTTKRTTIRVQASLQRKTHLVLKVLAVRTGRTLAEVLSQACDYAASSKGFVQKGIRHV